MDSSLKMKRYIVPINNPCPDGEGPAHIVLQMSIDYDKGGIVYINPKAKIKIGIVSLDLKVALTQLSEPTSLSLIDKVADIEVPSGTDGDSAA